MLLKKHEILEIGDAQETMRIFIAGLTALAIATASLTLAPLAGAQETEAKNDQEIVEKVKEQTAAAADQIKERAAEIGKTLDQSDTAQDVSAGILDFIYKGAEYVGQYPAFYWTAFTLMAAGVVSFLLQIVFTKFFLLFKLHINIKEMLSDILGLAISSIGIILTTQAAAQNSTFTQSPSAVISATAVGVVVGFVFYIWGQRQEFQAAKGYAAGNDKDES